MGLDMYLSRRTYVKNWDHRPDKWEVTVKHNGEPVPVSMIDTSKISYIEEDVAYWRKSNHIHRWFVTNVQDGNDDCSPYPVNCDQLRELLSTVKQVIDKPSKADELLPTQSGFFFGGTEYDDWYFSDLLETVKMLEPLVEANKEFSHEYIYQSSW